MNTFSLVYSQTFIEHGYFDRLSNKHGFCRFTQIKTKIPRLRRGMLLYRCHQCSIAASDEVFRLKANFHLDGDEYPEVKGFYALALN